MIKTTAELEREILARKLNTRNKNKVRKFRPRKVTLPTVTMDNLKTARAYGGVYNSALKCVEYVRGE